MCAHAQTQPPKLLVELAVHSRLDGPDGIGLPRQLANLWLSKATAALYWKTPIIEIAT